MCVFMQVPRVELTLSELQEMATRQQQQIEAQQQMLLAKVTHKHTLTRDVNHYKKCVHLGLTVKVKRVEYQNYTLHFL